MQIVKENLNIDSIPFMNALKSVEGITEKAYDSELKKLTLNVFDSWTREGELDGLISEYNLDNFAFIISPNVTKFDSSELQKKIRKKNYLSNFIGRVGTPKKRVKGSKYIMINGSAGKKTIFEVKNKKLTPIFTVRNTDKTRLKKRPFLRPVAVLVSKKIPQMYKNNAEFQFKKYLK